jgi:hypothetical protein
MECLDGHFQSAQNNRLAGSWSVSPVSRRATGAAAVPDLLSVIEQDSSSRTPLSPHQPQTQRAPHFHSGDVEVERLIAFFILAGVFPGIAVAAVVK